MHVPVLNALLLAVLEDLGFGELLPRRLALMSEICVQTPKNTVLVRDLK
jgi:hypothetical protein